MLHSYYFYCSENRVKFLSDPDMTIYTSVWDHDSDPAMIFDVPP
jgi:hypothetical protein